MKMLRKVRETNSKSKLINEFVKYFNSDCNLPKENTIIKQKSYQKLHTKIG